LRTLTLLDSQRVVGSNYNGAVDISQMPQMLIQRIDVVTAVLRPPGVRTLSRASFNFVTDKKFEGFKMNALAGMSRYGDMARDLPGGGGHQLLGRSRPRRGRRRIFLQ